MKEKLLMQFAQVMAEDVANEAAVATTLKRMFANVDEMLEEQEDIDVHNSGVTLVMAVLDENGVTIANCGDCRAIFGTQHPTKPRKLNVEVIEQRVIVVANVSADGSCRNVHRCFILACRLRLCPKIIPSESLRNDNGAQQLELLSAAWHNSKAPCPLSLSRTGIWM